MNDEQTRSGARRYDRRIAHYEDADGFALIEQLARRRGIGATALLRLLVREEAARQGLTDGSAASTAKRR